MTTNTPRVRFAPSPTGQLHLGGARTALFNWLFAKHHHGKFLLRIEDTDRQRSKQEHTDQICESMLWLGLTWDEGIVYQSKRLEIYQKAIQSLLKTDNAYRCFCSKDDLSRQREDAQKRGDGYQYNQACRNLSEDIIEQKLSSSTPFTVRLRVPEKVITFKDRIYGEINVNTNELDDFIIARTDGHPTYNLVVVVDDNDMNISHVIRGEDHISNTPKQILIYDALALPIPEFAHLPMILGPDKRRLSKRHGATGVQEYRDMGYLSQALNNYLALLGWNPGTEEEIFSLPRLTEVFSIGQIQKKPAVYDEKKLQWVSGQHLFKLSGKELMTGVRRIFPDWQKNEEDTYVENVCELLKLRAKSLTELKNISTYFFKDPKSYDEKAVRKRWKNDSVNSLVKQLLDELTSLVNWTESGVEISLRNVAEKEGISAGKLIHPVRLALSGVSAGPSLFAMMELLEKETCLRRIETALERLPIQ